MPVLRTSNDSFVWLRLIEILQVSVALYLFAAEFLVKTLVVFASTSAAVGKLANTTSLGNCTCSASKVLLSRHWESEMIIDESKTEVPMCTPLGVSTVTSDMICTV